MGSTNKRRLRRMQKAESDQSEEEFESPPRKSHKVVAQRSSERIKKKQNRKFQRPSRDDVFDAIPSTTSPQKCLDGLKPRKIVNNFMKETNRYNYDPASTDESSLDEFINDDESESESAEESTDSDDSPSHRVQSEDSEDERESSFHLRQSGPVLHSDSDEESGTETKTPMKHNSLIESDSDGENDQDVTKDSIMSKEVDSAKNGVGPDESATAPTCAQSTDGIANKSVSASEISESELISPKRIIKAKKRTSKAKRQILDSDSSDSSLEAETCKKRVVLASDVSEDDQSDRLYSSNEDSSGDDYQPRRRPSSRAEMMASRRRERTSLLEELHSKRKSKSE